MASLSLQRRLRAAWTTVGRCFAGAVLALCLGTSASVAQDDEDVQPDVSVLRAKAEAGNAKAQTQLADFCIGSDEFTNAVVWYRKAAEQGDVTAQLSLASLLIAGRGVAKDQQEAAKWLRAAADGIESRKPGYGPGAVVTARTNLIAATNMPPMPPPLLVTKTNPPPITNVVAALPLTNALPASPPSLTRVPRAGVMDGTTPLLHEVPPALRPPSQP